MASRVGLLRNNALSLAAAAHGARQAGAALAGSAALEALGAFGNDAAALAAAAHGARQAGAALAGGAALEARGALECAQRLAVGAFAAACHLPAGVHRGVGPACTSGRRTVGRRAQAVRTQRAAGRLHSLAARCAPAAASGTMCTRALAHPGVLVYSPLLYFRKHCS